MFLVNHLIMMNIDIDQINNIFVTIVNFLSLVISTFTLIATVLVAIMVSNNDRKKDLKQKIVELKNEIIEDSFIELIKHKNSCDFKNYYKYKKNIQGYIIIVVFCIM